MLLPFIMDKQESHFMQGSTLTPFTSQFTAMASNKAAVVFPQPGGPVKSKHLDKFLEPNQLDKIFLLVLFPNISDTFLGL
jgi:hypothetical protein